MILTQKCYNSLVEQLYTLQHNDIPEAARYMEECRQSGSLDDNPEYYAALQALDRLNKKADDLDATLKSATIFDKSMIQKDKVGFGATVEFKNCETNKKKKYTLVSIYDSDLNNGLISVDSPFAKEMINLEKGDFFTFNDVDYEIVSICFSCL